MEQSLLHTFDNIYNRSLYFFELKEEEILYEISNIIESIKYDNASKYTYEFFSINTTSISYNNDKKKPKKSLGFFVNKAAVAGAKTAVKTTGEKIGELIGAIIDFITNIIKRFTNTMKKVFGVDNILSAKEFKESQEFQVAVNDDYEKKLKEIEEQTATGDKLLKKICSSTGLPSNSIKTETEKFVSGVKKFLTKFAKPIFVTVGIGTAIKAGTMILTKDRLAKLSELSKRSMDKSVGIYKNTINHVKTTMTPATERLAADVSSAMSNLSKSLTSVYTNTNKTLISNIGKNTNIRVS